MNKSQIASIVAALNSANGKRRERLATLTDVASVVARVAKGETGKGIRRICGTVPNSYKYRASATTIAAARVGDVVRVRIFEGNAAKVSGGGIGWREGDKSDDVRALLNDESKLLAGDGLPVNRTGVIEIPVASAKRWPSA